MFRPSRLTAVDRVGCRRRAAWLAFQARGCGSRIDLSRTSTPLRRVLPVRTGVTWQVIVPTRYGPVPARLYIPTGGATRTLAVFPGVHSGGVDEPRLAAFSQRLAATGANVLSMPLPELRRYRITPVSTDTIEDGAAWLLADRTLAQLGHIGLAGVSFAGGLALVAAGRPSLVNRIDLVVALGSHADLPRVLTYLCTGRLTDGTVWPPHDYGIVITLLAAIPHLVPPDQTAALRQAVLDFLDASSTSSTDQPRSVAMFAAVRRERDAAGAVAPVDGQRNDRNVGTSPIPFRSSRRWRQPGASQTGPHRQAPSSFARIGGQHHPLSGNPVPGRLPGQHGNTRVEWLPTPLVTRERVPAGAAEA
jgi:hypothetical protein